LAVFSIGTGVLLLQSPESQILSHRGGRLKSNRSKVSANAIFLAKLSNKEIYFLKNGPEAGPN
jgi:hypothetical protein